MNALVALRRSAALAAVVVVMAAVQAIAAPLADAQTYVPISGSGSTWSFNALDQWRRNVEQLYGIRINFAPSGSSQGRVEFKNGTTDFAVSEIEYGLTDNGVVDTPPQRGFAYMPIVAGGTSFMYNLKIGTKQVTNLRLSGETIAKIFTRQITNWSDPAIKVDNPGLTLPARPIVPVVRSDGSGTTAQFTRYLAAKYGPIWDAYCGRGNCGFTSTYPTKPGVEAKSGSQGVAGFVAQASSEGAITYVEYSYARNARFPVVKVLNQAGYYVEPTASSVAVALTKTVIRADLTSDLSGVYANPDKRTYPLSSYSYMILPTDNNGGRFTNEKGATLSRFAYYFLCQGQQQADQLGYSPLPVNLVQAGVRQAARIPGTTNTLTEGNLAGCNNPTLSPDGSNKLAATAPQPSECDRKGAAAQCNTGTAGAQQQTPTAGGGGISQNANAGATGTTSGSAVTGGTGTTNGGSGAGGAGGGSPGSTAAGAAGTAAGAAGTGGTAATGTSGAAGTTGTGGTAGGTAAGTVDPETGNIVGAAVDPATGQTVDANGTALASNVSAIPVQVALPDETQRIVLGILAVVLLLALILGPPIVSRTMARRGDPS